MAWIYSYGFWSSFGPNTLLYPFFGYSVTLSSSQLANPSARLQAGNAQASGSTALEVFGGVNDVSGATFNEFWRLNVATEMWTYIDSYSGVTVRPSSRFGLGMENTSDKIFVLGGQSTAGGTFTHLFAIIVFTQGHDTHKRFFRRCLVCDPTFAF